MLECEKCRTPMVIDFEDYDVIIYKCPECGHEYIYHRPLP